MPDKLSELIHQDLSDAYLIFDRLDKLLASHGLLVMGYKLIERHKTGRPTIIFLGTKPDCYEAGIQYILKGE